MATPLYIAQIHRLNGVTTLTVVGHGLTVADQNRNMTIVGASDPTVNGTFKIKRIVAPDTIQFDQPNLPSIPSGLVGGAVAFT